MPPTAQSSPVQRGVLIPLLGLEAHPENYRAHPDEQLERLVKSLAEFGQVRDIIVRGNHEDVYTIVAGHGVAAAAGSLGWPDISCTVVPASWSDAKVKAYLVADNELVRGAEDNDIQLATLLEEQRTLGQDLEALGWTDGELDELLAELRGPDRDVDDPSGGGDDFDTTPAEGPTRARRGDLWALGEHRLLCGDATIEADVRALCGEERPHAMWTDPPYGVNYVGKTKRKLTIEGDDTAGLDGLLLQSFIMANEVLAPGAAIYVASPTGLQGLTFLIRFAAQWPLRQMLAWVKDSMVLGHADYHYRHEMILYAIKPGEGRHGRGGAGWYGDNSQTSVFEIPRPKRSAEHPVMKPIALIAAMLTNSTRVGDIVYEPFAGSGSTLIAAERLQRACYAIEIDPRYVDVILARYEAETQESARLIFRGEEAS